MIEQNPESTEQETPAAPESHEQEPEAPEGTEEATETTEAEPEPETYPAETVRKLRKESAGYRERLRTSEVRATDAETRLREAVVREATRGILADPTDLDADELTDDDGWPDPEAIAAAARELVKAKPHLGDRRPRGDAGQGAEQGSGDVDLAGILRRAAS